MNILQPAMRFFLFLLESTRHALRQLVRPGRGPFVLGA